MEVQTLTIFEIIVGDDELLLAVNFKNLTTRQKYARKSFADIKTEFNNTEVQIFGSNGQLITKVVDVDVNASLAGFRNIFLKILRSSETDSITISDEMRIVDTSKK